MQEWINPNLSPEERKEIEKYSDPSDHAAYVQARTDVEVRLAQTIVENSYSLAHQIARAYAQKNGSAFIPLDVYNDLVERGILKKVYLR